jgi:hypothetical protein
MRLTPCGIRCYKQAHSDAGRPLPKFKRCMPAQRLRFITTSKSESFPAQANTRSFKEIVDNEEENLALFSRGVDIVPDCGGAGRKDAAADVLV